MGSHLGGVRVVKGGCRNYLPKLIVITYRKQEIFHAVTMKYRNSFSYLQRQIDRVLRFYKEFTKTYINDTTIFSKFFDEYFNYLRQIFDVFVHNNIFVNLKKIYIDYSTVNLLSQHVNSFDFITDKEKLKVIAKFVFSVTFDQFEIYLELIE